MPTNTYKQLLSLTAQMDFYIAEVVTVYTETSKVVDAYGQEYYAIGIDFPASTLVFIKDGIIQGEAPVLTTPVDAIV